MQHFMPVARSIIPACDVDKTRFEEIVRETRDIPQIGGYKIGASLALSCGLPALVKIARKHTDKPLIYDHQKAGTDIPDTGKAFIQVVRESGITALILFPQSGPATETEWIKCAQQQDLPVIVGGYMTHEHYLVSDGGYIQDEAVDRIYLAAADLGVTDFVVPGNKTAFITKIRAAIQKRGADPVFYAPGFIAQGGVLSDAANVAGPRWHAIIGRAIYDAPNIKKAALSLTKSI